MAYLPAGELPLRKTAAEGKSEEAQSQLLMERQARYEDLSKYYSVILVRCSQTRQAVEAGLTQHRDFAIKLEQQQIARVERLQADASLIKPLSRESKAQNDLKIAQRR
ncbi:hypothetical protein O9993_06060 [Vibrio lentus]|nr:hypothetical protein [Vibrio lentus]